MLASGYSLCDFLTLSLKITQAPVDINPLHSFKFFFLTGWYKNDHLQSSLLFLLAVEMLRVKVWNDNTQKRICTEEKVSHASTVKCGSSGLSSTLQRGFAALFWWTVCFLKYMHICIWCPYDRTRNTHYGDSILRLVLLNSEQSEIQSEFVTVVTNGNQ